MCTNKLEWLSVRLFKALELTQHFAAICGQDTFGVKKPDPEIFRHTVLRAGGEPAGRSWSAIPGPIFTPPARPRVPVIAVDFGYTEVPIETLQPDRIISSFSELPAAISAFLAAVVVIRPRAASWNYP